MCGIVGVYSFKEGISPSLIEGAANTIKHRGPDDEGYLAYDLADRVLNEFHGSDSVVKVGSHIRDARSAIRGVVLGHRRLSIIDPTPAGHQPMSYDHGKLWIVFNGEIYNYRELRSELEAKGHRFLTNTDTEVILASYAEWGARCLDRFNGMWSFAILDLRRNILFAARDRFGVKPFYYHWSNGLLVFASEIKAIIKLPFIERRIHEGRVYDHLMWGIIRSSEETFYQGISELLPSHYLVFNLHTGERQVEQYYRLQSNSELGKFDQKEFLKHVETVRELIYKAVRLRLRADVPIGSCLSGGIDSSSIVSTISEILKKEPIDQVGDLQRVYTACYKDPSIDESAYAQAVVEKTGSRWFRTYPTEKELWGDLERVVYAQDEPFGGPSIYAQYRVMQLAKQTGVKVLLDGQGGDEVFAGYDSQYPAFFMDLLLRGRVRDVISEWKGLHNAPLGRETLLRKMAEYVAVGFLPSGAKTFAARVLHSEGSYLNKDFVYSYQERNELITERASANVNHLSYQLLTLYTLPLLLRYEDRNSMAWSVESRTPFADDHPLIEYVSLVPGIYKIHKGWSKVLLREAMRPILPNQVYHRVDKKGFDTPKKTWLRELASECRQLLEHENQFVETRELCKDFDHMVSKDSHRTVSNIWRLIVFAVWRRVFQI